MSKFDDPTLNVNYGSVQAAIGRRMYADGETRITDPNTGGQKGQKPERYDLIPTIPHQELARVFGFGATKYTDDNWRKGYSWRLSVGALERHLAAFKQGESIDPESGCHHLAHAAWHCYVLQVFEREDLGTDDIPERLTEPAATKSFDGCNGECHVSCAGLDHCARTVYNEKAIKRDSERILNEIRGWEGSE